MNRTLKARIERLERRKTRRPFPRLILAIYGQPLESIIGYRNRCVVAMRTPGEPLDALEARAWTLGSAFIIEALYRPSSAVGRDDSDFGAITAADAPAEPSGPEIDEYAVGQPGIGAVADREALIRMGAIRVPPERLI